LKINLGEKSTLVLIVLSVAMLTAYSTPVLISEYYSVPLIQLATLPGTDVALVGIATDVTTTIDDVTVSDFDLYQGEQLIGNYKVTGTEVVEGDSVSVWHAADAIRIPFVYRARSWTEVRVNDEVLMSTVGHMPLRILKYVWLVVGISVAIRTGLWLRRWNKDRLRAAELGIHISQLTPEQRQ